MNRRTSLALATLFVLLGAGMAACNRPGSDDPPPCASEDLSAAEIIYPEVGSTIDDLSPSFSWSYPDPSCLPAEFSVYLSSSNSWLDSGPILAHDVLSGFATRWDPGVTLTPGDVYMFFIQSGAGGEGEPGVGHHFYTAPRCSGAETRQPPVLIAPEDGARLTGMQVHLRWDDPTPCVTAYYHYWFEVAPTPRFTGAYELWTSIFEDHILPDRYDTFSFEPCTTYFWRVRSATPPDGLDGLYSETWSFTTPAEPGSVCPVTAVITPVFPWTEFGPPASAHGAIAGHVWHDECAVPYATTDVVPAGCVLLPDGRLEANAALDAGEEGIEGVTVLLDDRPCPGVDGWSTTTDANGLYTFNGLSAGTYCVEIDAAADGNDAVLIPGNWTVPYRWYGPGAISAEVTLGSNDDISRLNDFGWDYQFLPSPGESSPATPMARVLADARCRLGPGTLYPIYTYLTRDQRLPILGRNADRSWWLVDLADKDRDCWLSGDVVETEGDTDPVPEQQAPPPPTLTPVPPGCWQRPNPQAPAKCVVPCPAGVENPVYCTP